MSIGNASKSEGNSGTSNMTFTVTLSKAATSAVSVQYATSDGTATAGNDFCIRFGHSDIRGGRDLQDRERRDQRRCGERAGRDVRRDFVAPSGVTISGATGTGTITNDDATGGTGGTGGTGTGTGDEKWGEAFFAPYIDMAGIGRRRISPRSRRRVVCASADAGIPAGVAGRLAAWWAAR